MGCFFFVAQFHQLAHCVFQDHFPRPFASAVAAAWLIDTASFASLNNASVAEGHRRTGQASAVARASFALFFPASL